MIEVRQCRECAAVPAYCDEDGCCSTCGNDLAADIAPPLKVKLVEHSPAKDRLIREVLRWAKAPADSGDSALLRAVERYREGAK